jgi:hypothetical protein
MVGTLPDTVKTWTRRILSNYGADTDADVNSVNVEWMENSHYRDPVDKAQPSSTTTLDLSNANLFRRQLRGDVTFTFAGASDSPAGNSVFLLLEQGRPGGHTPTWPSSVQWRMGVEPNLPDNEWDKHLLHFVTLDGGASWIGQVAAREVS